jgi:RNA polymerase sigma-70 factor (ECF subfamily)
VATTSDVSAQDGLYERAAAEYGAALGRLARGYEADAEKRRDLLQEVHLALWRSFAGFHVLVSLEEIEATPVPPDADRRMALERLTELIQRLQPLDRQVILAYLEGMDGAAIGELTGLSARNAATKVHRIKGLLARYFHEGERYAG